MANILVINGPNLNLLGKRENTLYGEFTLEELTQTLIQQAKGHSLECFQSNAEHEIIHIIQQAPTKKVDFIIINPAAFSHTSIAIRDALLAVRIPFYEVHLTNIYAREVFRHKTYFSDIALGVICGLGPLGYTAALNAILKNE